MIYLCQVLDEVDRILEEVKHDWLSCVERAVYDKRGWPQPLTAARYVYIYLSTSIDV